MLLGAQCVGEALRSTLHLPLPSPVIGLFLLAIVLATCGRGWLGPDGQSPLSQLSTSLIANMGLLFVPAGVGVIAELGVLRQSWLPILAGLLGSTILGLVTTAWVMHRLSATSAGRGPTKHGARP